MTEQRRLLSAECLAVADALRNVRACLVQLIAEGRWPQGSFPDLTTVQVHGLAVADALERLGRDREPGQRTPGPYDPDQRR